ncbi:hypothetical protein QUF72_17530 [Desulfobacterales bacterium HSG2]|nr:hypothetical protein [Desulfobacterales bacterium HSG2]
MKEEGLIGTVDYRPSKAAKIKYKISLLSEKGQNIALDIINGKREPQSLVSPVPGQKETGMDKDEKIKIIDLVADYVQYQHVTKKISKSQYRDIFLKTLKVRSGLGKPDKSLYNIPCPPRPDDVHESNRLHIGMGIKGDHFFQETGYRPVFSDLLDTDYGYKEGIQIEFGASKLRYYDADKKLALESLDLIDIVSISPIDKFFMSYSWKVGTGLARKRMRDGHDSLFYRLNTGGGFAFHNDSLGLHYLFMEPELDIGGNLEESYALGLGVSAGVIKRLSRSWKCHLAARTMYFAFGDTDHSHELSLSQNIRLSRNTSITLDVSWERAFDSSHVDAGVNWNIFF